MDIKSIFFKKDFSVTFLLNNINERRYKMKQKQILGILALTIVSILGFSLVSAHGFRMWYLEITDEEKMAMREHMESMQMAMSEGDYETWKSLMQDKISKMKGQLTEKDFNAMSDMYSKIGKHAGRGSHSEMKGFECPFAEN